jgi:hypothetical protein
VLETKDDDLKIQLLTTMKIALISLLSMTWHQVRKRPKRPAMNGTKLKVGTKNKKINLNWLLEANKCFICFEIQIWRSNKTICDLFSVCFSQRTY